MTEYWSKIDLMHGAAVTVASVIVAFDCFVYVQMISELQFPSATVLHVFSLYFASHDVTRLTFVYVDYIKNTYVRRLHQEIPVQQTQKAGPATIFISICLPFKQSPSSTASRFPVKAESRLKLNVALKSSF